MFQRVLLIALFLILLVACDESSGNPQRPPRNVTIEPDRREDRHIAVSIDSVEILDGGPRELHTPTEFRLLMLGADTEGHSGGIFCPTDEPMIVNVNTKVPRPCPIMLSFDEQAIGNEFYLLIVGLDEDSVDFPYDFGYEVGVGILAKGLVEAAKLAAKSASGGTGGPAGLAAEIAFEAVISYAGSEALNWYEQNDIIGQQALRLSRGDNWFVDRTLSLITQDGGMKINLHISRTVSPHSVPVQTVIVPPTQTVPSPTPKIPPLVETSSSEQPRPTTTPRPQSSINCPGAFPTRLSIGGKARVITYQINVRSGPSAGYSRVNRLLPGRIVTVLDGPECDDGQLWYHIISDPFVARDTGQTITVEGWAAEESGSQYFLEPVD